MQLNDPHFNFQKVKPAILKKRMLAEWKSKQQQEEEDEEIEIQWYNFWIQLNFITENRKPSRLMCKISHQFIVVSLTIGRRILHSIIFRHLFIHFKCTILCAHRTLKITLMKQIQTHTRTRNSQSVNVKRLS